MDKRTAGAFTMELLRPGLSHTIWQGEATAQAFRELREFGLACREASGPGAVMNGIIDAREATGLDRGARKELQELGRAKPWDRVVFIGVRFEVKVLLELVIRALQLMKMDTAEVSFVDTAEQAEAWLADGPTPPAGP